MPSKKRPQRKGGQLGQGGFGSSSSPTNLIFVRELKKTSDLAVHILGGWGEENKGVVTELNLAMAANGGTLNLDQAFPVGLRKARESADKTGCLPKPQSITMLLKSRPDSGNHRAGLSRWKGLGHIKDKGKRDPEREASNEGGRRRVTWKKQPGMGGKSHGVRCQVFQGKIEIGKRRQRRMRIGGPIVRERSYTTT